MVAQLIPWTVSVCCRDAPFESITSNLNLDFLIGRENEKFDEIIRLL